MAGMTARPQFPVGPFYVKNCSLFGFAITYANTEQYDPPPWKSTGTWRRENYKCASTAFCRCRRPPRPTGW